MRILTILILAAGLLLRLPAAEPAPAVKIRQFLDQRNVVIQSRETELGSITDKYNATITFTAVTCTTLAAKPGMAEGVEVTLTYPKAEGAQADEQPTSVTVYLDYDELSVFREGIGTLVTAADGWEDAKSLNTISMKSRDDFMVRISRYPGADASVVSVSGYDGDNFVFAFFDTPQHILSIKGYLEKALKVLQPPNAKP